MDAADLTCELCTTLRQVQHQPKKHCYRITLEVPEPIGARIMDYAAMVGGLRPWDESRLLDGGLRLTERKAERLQTWEESDLELMESKQR